MIRDTTSRRVALGALLVGSLSMAAVDSRSGRADSPLHPVRETAATVLAPVESGLVLLARPVTGLASGIGHGSNEQTRIAALTADNIRLSAALRTAVQGKTDAASLAAVNAMAADVGAVVKAAHVIAVAPDHGYSRTVAIDLGSNDGVAPDTSVLDATGLVGRVISVTPTTATVLLLVDPISSLGVRMSSSGQIGTLTGTGADFCRLVLFDRSVAPKVGEEVVSFGSRGGRPYAAGVPVGVVTSVTPRENGAEIMVRPYSRFGTLDTVGVVTPNGGRKK